jgi:signal transduction histidine kinase
MGWAVRYGEGALGQVALTGEASLTDGTSHLDPFPLPQAMRDAAQPWRWMFVPLVWRQRLIGVLAMQAEPARPPFGEVDTRLARLVASQAANALGVAVLFDAEREQRRISEALHEASLAINRAVGLEQVLDAILEQVMRAFPCDAANFQVYRDGRASPVRFRGYETHGLTAETMAALSFEVDAYANYRLMLAGEAVCMPETHSDPAWTVIPGFEWIRSWAGVPIRFGDEVMGFLNLDSATPGALGQATALRLPAFAAHAAVAMNNARLYQKLTDEHIKLVRVYEIGQHVSSSLVPDEILRSLLGGVLEAYGGSFAAAYAVASGAGAAVEIPAGPTVSIGSEEATAGASLPPEILAARVAQLQAPYQEVVHTAVGRAWASGVPLFVGDRLWGSALVWSAYAGEGEPPPLGVLAAASQQAGLALLNAEQHSRVQRRLAELTLVQGVASAVARRLETDAVLSTVTERLHDTLHYPAVQVYFREGDDLVLRTFSGPEPLTRRMPVSRGIIGRVARTGGPAIVPDVRSDPDYVASLVGTRAQMSAPVRVQDNVIAVINVESSEASQIQPENLELLMVVADQVSGALQNAALYEQVRANVGLLGDRVRERTQQLERALDQARAADRSKAQFVAEISHELRTPMTNIGLYLDLLDMGRDERRSEYMAILRHETERLGVLIEQLLAISEYDREKVELHLSPVDLNALLRVLIADRARMIEGRGLSLHVEMDESVPKALADSRQIMQVMTNLLTNATNYSPSGGAVTMRTCSRSAEGLDWVTFSIADTGPGIPEEERPHVFERFFRGIVGRASGVPGTGLGLAICKEIVEHHQGRIQISAEGGKGTTVIVWLRPSGPEP